MGAIELLRFLMVGDVVGRPGREAINRLLPDLLEELRVDFCVVNGENAAQGAGITRPMAVELFQAGADCVTLGNHTWARREIAKFLEVEPRLIRPANYPPGTPGSGIFRGRARTGQAVAVINLMGRVYMPNGLDCPFRVGEQLLEGILDGTAILVDFHAEATSEKIAYGRYVDGRVSAVLGTHTHVPTADECILPRGTAFQSDVGMTGPIESIIGMNSDIALKRFLTGLPHKAEVGGGTARLMGTLIDVDRNGRAIHIERVTRDLERP